MSRKQQNPLPDRISNRQAIDKMTADAYKRGGSKLADKVRQHATKAAIRDDRS